MKMIKKILIVVFKVILTLLAMILFDKIGTIGIRYSAQIQNEIIMSFLWSISLFGSIGLYVFFAVYIWRFKNG
ncbi:hypothetical protein LCGC14_1518940 [marine sediment metagenome]|uniref:Uncharacterized protein n=1 Tax=marine sediment metagenome TaxID=412755 RepID=A0A0F9JK21_9ZZZZ